MKKFIDDEIEMGGESIFRVIQAGLSLILLAPYKMFDQISIRIIYLKKSQIAGVLLASLLIGFSMIAMKIGIMVYTNTFSLTKGRFPLLSMLIGGVFLGLVYILFGSIKMMAFSKISDIGNSTSSIEFDNGEESGTTVAEEVESFGGETKAEVQRGVDKTFSWFWGENEIKLGKGQIQLEQNNFIDSSILEGISATEDNYDYDSKLKLSRDITVI